MTDETGGATAQVAVVTGAGTGIGRAVTRALLDAGYRVTLAGRRADALAEAAAGHPRALVVPTDVTAPAEVENLFARTVETWGRVDVLFNNAGTFGAAGSAADITPEEWERTLAVNVTGALLCAGAAMRAMRAQQPRGGRIINNGSISAHVPRPLSVAYTVSKHAITGLTRSIDLDGRADGIRAGQIDIGNARTEILDEIGVGAGALQPDGTRRVEPTFDVADAARAVLFMAQLPPDANVLSMTVTASGMPFGGRG